MTVSRNVPAPSASSGSQPHRQNNDNRADQSRVEPESVPMLQNTTQSNLPREPEAKQIDYNDSIRSTYFSIDDLRACGASLAEKGTSALPGFFPFEFRARHRENEKEILRVYRATAADVEAGASITPAAEWLLDKPPRRRRGDPGGTARLSAPVLPATADPLGLRNRHPAHDGACLALRCPYP
ncbi:hypothetical protein ACVII0_004979 [Sinorhizobium meliloti]